MSFDGYIKELDIKLGKMFYQKKDAIGITQNDSLLGDIKLIKYDNASGSITGQADVSDSAYKAYAWMAGKLDLSGTSKENAFEMAAALPGVSVQLGNALFQAQKGALHLYNQKEELDFSDIEIYTSGSKVELNGTLSLAGAAYEASLFFIPFEQEKITPVKVVFSSKDKKVSCLEFLTGLCGAVADISSQLPSWAAYQDILELEGITFLVDSESLKKKTKNGLVCCNAALNVACSVELAFDMTGLPVKSEWFSWKKLAMSVQFEPSSSKKIWVSGVSGQFSVLGIDLNVQAVVPYFSMEVETDKLSGTSINKLLEKFSLKTPSMLEGMELKRIYLLLKFEEKQYYASVSVGRAKQDSLPGHPKLLMVQENMGEDGSSSINLRDASLNISSLGDKTNVLVRVCMDVIKGDATACQFMFEGKWTDSAVHLKGRLMRMNASLTELYNSFFGVQITTELPTVQVKGLTVEAVVDKGSVSVESLEGSVSVSVTDKDVIGQTIEIAQAKLACDKDSFMVEGSFRFGTYFTIGAEYYRSDKELKWKFFLELDKIKIEVSYDKGKKIVSGTIVNDYTLGDMLDFLLGLLNPSESFDRTGAWSFLNDISIKNTKVSYNVGTQEFSFTITPSVSRSFIELSALTVKMGSTGVKLQIQGTFMEQEYGEKNPLEFSPNAPVSVQGCGIFVNYLLFGTGIRSEQLTGTDVVKDMESLQKQFSRDTKISELKLDENAGSMFAVETEIADVVRVQLLYLEDYTYCGGRFELYGDNAGALKGLCAELSYSRVKGALGVFSGKFKPSESMRRIPLGAMIFYVGNIEAQIYSNGDFYLDFGYPYEKDFSRSFAFQYGIFNGSGGVYLKKISAAQAGSLPDLPQRYFTNVLSMGIGMKLRLGYDYNGKVFKAQAALVMQGFFEGLYARKQPKKNTDNEYYKLAAGVMFTGTIQGKVDFGIIGAAVNIYVNAAMNLTISSDKPLEADIRFEVKAQASVKVVFVRVKFSFSLSTKMHFSFASKNVLQEQAYAYPRGLSASCMQAQGISSADIIEINCQMIPVITRYADRPTAAVMLVLEPSAFASMADRLMQVLNANNALEICGMELFAGRRIAETPEEIYDILEKNFIFKISEPKENAEDSSGVLMPLPEQVTLIMEKHYRYGSVDTSVRVLEEYEMMDESYKELVEGYYEDTLSGSERETEDSENPRSVQSYLFTDFFDMLFKAIRAQKESDELCGRVFDIQGLSSQQYENMQGIMNRFVLGGRRGPKKTGINGVTGMFRIAGSQIEFVLDEDINQYVFSLQKGEHMPKWLCFADQKESLIVSMTPADMESQLPAEELPARIFDMEPEILPFYDTVKEDAIYPSLSLCASGCYFQASNSMETGKKYIASVNEWGYAGLFSLVIEKAGGSPSLYRIKDYRNVRHLADWINKAGEITGTSCIYGKDGEYSEFGPKEQNIICLKNIASGSQGKKTYAEMSQIKELLSMFLDSFESAGEYFLYFPSNARLPDDDSFEIWFALKFGNGDGREYQDWYNGIYAQEDKISVEPKQKERLQQVTEQGTVQVKVHVKADGLKDSEQRLKDLYSGLAAELIDKNGKALTHETPSYFEKQDDNGVFYVLPFPYVKALTHDVKDIYKGVPGRESYRLRLFWTDILGNRMETGKIVEFSPKYHDRLMGLEEYPSLGLSASLCENKIRIQWEPVKNTALSDEEKERLRYGYNQLMADDVKLSVSAEGFGISSTLDKSRFTGFLKSVVENGSSEGLVYDIPVTVEENVMKILSADVDIQITRQPELCEKGYNGIDIQTYTTKLTIQKSSDSRVELLFGAGGACLLAGVKDSAAQIGEKYYFRAAALPTVSGEYTGANGDKVQLAGRNLEEILQQFLDDFAQLTSPDILLRLALDKKGITELEKINVLYQNAVEAVSKLVKPLCSYPDKDIDASQIEQYVKAFFMGHLALEPKSILFGQAKITGQTADGNLSLRGIVGDGDGFTTNLGLSKNSNTFCFALKAEESCREEELQFKTRYVYDGKNSKLLTPDNPSAPVYSMPFKGTNHIAPAFEGIPRAPIVTSVYRSETAVEIDLRVCMASEDKLLLGIGDTKSMQSFGKEQIYTMEQYRLKSREYLKGTDIEDYTNLIRLMESYVSAVKEFVFTTKQVSCYELSLQDKGESGYRKLGCSKEIKDARVFVSSDFKEWTQMQWQTDGYTAKNINLTEGGFCLRIITQGAQEAKISLQAARQKQFVEGSGYAVSPEHILCTPQAVI